MKLSFLLLIVYSQLSFGQDTTYFDLEWQPSERTNAEYFRVDLKVGNNWTRTDNFFKTNQLQMKGTYSSIMPEVENGYFEWYHSNGKLKHTGNYENGKEIGEHFWYSENGNIEAKENYSNGELNGAYEEYYSNGKLMDKTSFTNGLQNGWTEYYREDCSKQSEGNFKDGNKDGIWKYYDENGILEGTNVFKIDYEIKEAKMLLKLPNDEWYLANQSDKGGEYVFKRNIITDSLDREIIPAIMVYIEDATEYKQDLVLYSLQKRLAFKTVSINVEKVLIPSDKDFPFQYKNAMVMVTSYSDKGFNHIFYMVYIITKDNKGIQLYMDMTKEISEEYEQEFWTTLKSIKLL